MKDNKKRTYLIIGIVLFLILVLGATYAYFAITSVNNATGTKITGTGEDLGTPTLSAGPETLSLYLTYDMVGAYSGNSHRRWYATPDGTGILINGAVENMRPEESELAIGNGRYVMATASLDSADVTYNCDYAFDISASTEKDITDDSDYEVHLVITSPNGETYRYMLKQLLNDPKTISGTLSLSGGDSKEFIIESYFYNLLSTIQNDLSGNSYEIKVTPKSGTDGFNCTVATEPVIEGFAKQLIDNGEMIQTGFEGDGYRYTGTTNDQWCIYDGWLINAKKTDGTCRVLYHYAERDINTSEILYEDYSTYDCTTDEDTDTYTVECNLMTSSLENIPVNNYVCFGTDSLDECLSTEADENELTGQDKYLYRIIGVFPDKYGNQHVKLIKNTSIGEFMWNSEANNGDWDDSDLFKGLNDSYFLTNPYYAYLQENAWLNKIADWRWISAADQIYPRGTGNSSDSEIPMSYTSRETLEDIYLHEMNRTSKKYNEGYWSYVNAKIGLIYISDFYLSLPLIENKSYNDYRSLKYTGSWLFPNSSEDVKAWTMNLFSNFINQIFVAGQYYGDTKIGLYKTEGAYNTTSNVIPTFYLNSNVESSGGSGTITDPYMITE